jgi:hypothetical protein
MLKQKLGFYPFSKRLFFAPGERMGGVKPLFDGFVKGTITAGTLDTPDRLKSGNKRSPA